MTKAHDPTLAAIGKNVKRIRRASGKTQEGLALEAEIDRTYVSQIERGIANPSVLVLRKVAFCLGATLSEIVAGA
ncbi:helix-turn-helix domain-containing protein [Massilia sp. UYP32]|uniref:helix-turn-helix domain-containing protein n=1 Tax=Massilia sp. UYP32 TaxID=1756386 RepID=UPI003D1C150B